VMFTNEDQKSATFDFERWGQHRSESRYYRIPLGAFLGVTTRRISSVVIPLMLFSSAVCLYGQAGLKDPTLPTIQLPLQPFELTAPALGLLLVFRSDNAFSRFRYGSELTWDITTSIRSAMRRLLAMTGSQQASAAERAAADELVQGLVLLHHWIMNQHLRQGAVPSEHEDLVTAALGKEAEEALPVELGVLTPYHGVELLSLGMRRRLPSLTDQEFIAMEDTLSSITQNLGQCERLLRTPIPLGYTRYSVRFLWIWLTLLPFALTRTFCGFQEGTWWEGRLDEPWPLVVSSVTFIASIFLSIEDIAVQIEEPFAVLPLDMHHQWLLRDVETSHKLMLWSSNALEGASPQKASGSQAQAAKQTTK
jgi:putative membrane protein